MLVILCDEFQLIEIKMSYNWYITLPSQAHTNFWDFILLKCERNCWRSNQKNLFQWYRSNERWREMHTNSHTQFKWDENDFLLSFFLPSAIALWLVSTFWCFSLLMLCHLCSEHDLCYWSVAFYVEISCYLECYCLNCWLSCQLLLFFSISLSLSPFLSLLFSLFLSLFPFSSTFFSSFQVSLVGTFICLSFVYFS